MSDNNIQNEQDLWDVLSEPVTVESKAAEPKKPKPNPEGRFAKPGPMKEVEPVKEGRKLDGFFLFLGAGFLTGSPLVSVVTGSLRTSHSSCSF